MLFAFVCTTRSGTHINRINSWFVEYQAVNYSYIFDERLARRSPFDRKLKAAEAGRPSGPKKEEVSLGNDDRRQVVAPAQPTHKIPFSIESIIATN